MRSSGSKLIVIMPLSDKSDYEKFQLAVHDPLNVGGLSAGPVIFDQIIGVKDVTAYLTAPFYFLFGIFEFLHLFLLFFLGQLIKARPQHFHGRRFVFELAPFRLTLHDNAAGNMGNAHRR